jgi:hypothetical protein
MEYFQNKNPNLGKFLARPYVELKMFVYLIPIWCILYSLGNLEEIWHILPRFGIFCQDKSGNPELYRDFCAVILSSFCIGAIACDRFRFIMQPHKKQMTAGQVRGSML